MDGPNWFLMTAEWNDQYYTASLRDGWRFSWGSGINNVQNADSGADPMGTLVPFACKIRKIQWFVGNVGAETGSTSFSHRITKNGSDIITTYNWAATGSGGNSFTRDATPNLILAAGDHINLRLVSPTGYGSTNQIGRVRVVFWLEVLEDWS